MIILEWYRVGQHGGFIPLHSAGVKKILGTWMTLPAIAKSGSEQNIHLVLTEEKNYDSSHFIITLLN